MKEENSFEVKDRYPEKSLAECLDEVDKIAKALKVMPLPKKMYEAADLMESVSYKMMVQAEESRKNAKFLDDKFISMFKDGGVK